MTPNQEEKWLLKEKYNDVASEAFQADLERLRAGEPLAYVIGHAPFLGCSIYLDSHPLSPRPETEYWVEKALPFIRMKGLPVRVLDLCAGSGCVGVAVAKTVPEAHVTFAEIDGSHLPTIEKNIDLNFAVTTPQNLSINRKVLRERFEVVQSDLFESVSGKFDFILTNPPYIDLAVDRTELSVKAHEPHLALYGGVRGMEIIDRIIADAPEHLNEAGQLWIEHEPEQSEAIKKSVEAGGFRAVTHLDQYGVERYSVLSIS